MTALIGGPGDNEGVGAAWVFTRSGTTWTQQGAKLTGSGETGAGEFGTSVALSPQHHHDRADRRPRRQQQRRRGVGVHARGHDLERAGRKAHRQRGDRRRRIRHERGAVRPKAPPRPR